MSFTSTLSGLDFTIPELPAKDVVFRIYRDTRFSKDPTPYKVSNECALAILPFAAGLTFYSLTSPLHGTYSREYLLYLALA